MAADSSSGADEGPEEGGPLLRARRHHVCLVQLTNQPPGADALTDASMLAWFLYAKRHGYRYLRYAAEEGRSPHADAQTNKCDISWRKVEAARRLLPRCALLALLDTDVVMANWSVRFETLLTHWNFSGAPS